MSVVGLDHVQLAIPEGGEDLGRKFYGEQLGLAELPKPAALAKRGGVWFACGSLQLHLGVDKDFRAATKAHPALVVVGLPALIERLRLAGYTLKEDEPLDGYDRIFVNDPFGNRVELLEPR